MQVKKYTKKPEIDTKLPQKISSSRTYNLDVTGMCVEYTISIQIHGTR